MWGAKILLCQAAASEKIGLSSIIERKYLVWKAKKLWFQPVITLWPILFHDRSTLYWPKYKAKNVLPVMVEPPHPNHPTTFLTVENSKVQTLVSTFPLQ